MTNEELKALRESLQNRSIHYRETSDVVAIIVTALDSRAALVTAREELQSLKQRQGDAITNEHRRARAAAMEEAARWLEKQRWEHGDSGDISEILALAKLPATMAVVERETLMAFCRGTDLR